MPEDVFVYLGQCLRDAREECGLTQQELADQTGRGLRHLQDIEKGPGKSVLRCTGILYQAIRHFC